MNPFQTKLLWMVLLAGLLLFPSGRGVAAEISDGGIRDAIEDQILMDEVVGLNDIDVVVVNGVATLIGTVDNLLTKERAVRLAETVRGVRSVIDRITVDPPENRSDAAVRRDVKAALLSNPATESFEVDVEVDGGTVVLDGTVSSWAEVELAELVAKGVRGVVAVDNRLWWNPEKGRPDSEIRRDIEERLKWDVLIEDSMIEVLVSDGAVTLNGKVGSVAEKFRAVSNAWVAGVHKVHDFALEVDSSLRDRKLRKQSVLTVPDEDLRQAIRDALTYDPRVRSHDVEVEVEEGVATLRGKVYNLGALRAAAADARHTTGTIQVRNRLRVRADRDVEDEMLEGLVQSALERDPFVNPYEITVQARNGVVDLYGRVDSYFEKGQADHVASNVAGVVVVDNHLFVDSDHVPYVGDPYIDNWYLYDYDWYDYRPRISVKTDAGIQDSIKRQLWWSPFVDSDEVHVTVQDGTAILTGSVDSWMERKAAQQNAYEGGAAWVINKLEVHVGDG